MGSWSSQGAQSGMGSGQLPTMPATFSRMGGGQASLLPTEGAGGDALSSFFQRNAPNFADRSMGQQIQNAMLQRHPAIGYFQSAFGGQGTNPMAGGGVGFTGQEGMTGMAESPLVGGGGGFGGGGMGGGGLLQQLLNLFGG